MVLVCIRSQDQIHRRIHHPNNLAYGPKDRYNYLGYLMSKKIYHRLGDH
jgi:hypothetical protein